MSGYPLRAILDLKRREEDAAATRLSDATLALAGAQDTESRHVARVEMARLRLGEALAANDDPDGGGLRTVAAVATQAVALFVSRRRQELASAQLALEEFQRGPLTRARDKEEVARNDHLAARRTREAFEKHAEKHRAAEKVSANRREDDGLEDIARAISHTNRGKTNRD